MLRWTGFADLTFASSARLAFARALERAETDVHERMPEAWVIDERYVSFTVDVEILFVVMRATRRLLEALVLEATAGEAVMEISEPRERWARAAAPSISKEISTGSEDYDGPGETIRTETL